MSLQVNLESFDEQWLKPHNQKSKIQKNRKISPNSISNQNQNHLPESDSIFFNYEILVGQLTSNQYNISILTANLLHLEQQYENKQKIFLAKQKEVQKIKNINKKTHEALQTEIHRSKKLKYSAKKNKQQLREIQEKIKVGFKQRFNTQEYKNQLYEEFKQLQEEYHSKLEQLKHSYQSKESNQNSLSNSEETKFSKENRKSLAKVTENDNLFTPDKDFQILKQQNQRIFPFQLQKAYQQIQKLEDQLQRKLQKRQLTKLNIKENTQNIKSYEQQQFDSQMKIQALQQKLNQISIEEQRINHKKNHINQLFHQINSLKQQIDQKCSQENDLVNYLREVQKQEKQMRRLRKIQVQCEKQQNIYKKQKIGNKFSVIQSQQDHQEQLFAQKIQCHAFEKQNTKKDILSSRLDQKMNEKIIDLIQRYQKLKQK